MIKKGEEEKYLEVLEKYNNILILGISGQGKSYLINDILTKNKMYENLNIIFPDENYINETKIKENKINILEDVVYSKRRDITYDYFKNFIDETIKENRNICIEEVYKKEIYQEIVYELTRKNRNAKNIFVSQYTNGMIEDIEKIYDILIIGGRTYTNELNNFLKLNIKSEYIEKINNCKKGEFYIIDLTKLRKQK